MNRQAWLYIQKTGILAVVYLILQFLLPLVLPFFLAWLTVHFLVFLNRRLHIRLFLLSILYLFLLTLFFAAAGFCGCCLLYQPCRELIPVCQNYWEQCADYLSWLPESLSGQMIARMPDLFSFGFGVLLYYISVLLIARDWTHVQNLLRRLPFSLPISRASQRIAKATRGWVKAQGKIMLVVTLECAVGYYLLHIPYFFLWAVLTGFVDALPVFGTGFVFFPWGAILLLQKDYKLAGWIAVLFLVTWLTRELMEPKLLGEGLGLLPIGFLVSVVAGLQLFGGIGLFTGPFGVLLIKELWAELEKSAPPERS